MRTSLVVMLVRFHSTRMRLSRVVSGLLWWQACVDGHDMRGVTAPRAIGACGSWRRVAALERMAVLSPDRTGPPPLHSLQCTAHMTRVICKA